MLTVALIGPPGCGKTTLAYTLTHFLSKRDVPAAWANLDPFCKRLAYPVVYDVREHYAPRRFARTDEKPDAIAKRIYADVAGDARYAGLKDGLRAGGRSAFMLDLYGGVDFYALGGGAVWLHKLADVAVFVADDKAPVESIAGAARLVAAAAKIPVVAVQNKADLVAKPKHKAKLSLSRFADADVAPNTGAAGVGVHGVLGVSAADAVGFAELWRAVSTSRV